MECKNCGCLMNKVTHTRQIQFRTHTGRIKIIIRRRRVCRHCQLPFITVEYPEDEDNRNHPEEPEALPPIDPAGNPSGKSVAPDHKPPENPFV